MTISNNNNFHAPNMTRIEFINELKKRLSFLPADERDRSIQYYNEIIDDRMENGMDEITAVACCESPAVIAERIYNEAGMYGHANQTYANTVYVKQKRSAGMILLLILGSPLWFSLAIAFFSIVFSMYAVIWSVIFSLFCIAFACAVACAALVLVAPVAMFGNGIISSLFCAGTGLISGAVAIAFWIISVCCVKYLWNFTKLSFKKIIGIFKRR